jgi:8-oxo-dGTP pyrophosphatase MutT (NUDIX family)
VIKHGTASVFVFAPGSEGWLLAMVQHPRLSMVMIPGGHIETDENAEQGAVREVLEETGLPVRLLPAPAACLPPGYPHRRLEQPWWITELAVPRDSHVGEAHVHVDHLFVGLADSRDPVSPPVHDVVWLSEEQVAAHGSVFEDTKVLAKELFAAIGSLASA